MMKIHVLMILVTQKLDAFTKNTIVTTETNVSPSVAMTKQVVNTNYLKLMITMLVLKIIVSLMLELFMKKLIVMMILSALLTVVTMILDVKTFALAVMMEMLVLMNIVVPSKVANTAM
jgi:hypothetical protein